jgi:hypothetical protein
MRMRVFKSHGMNRVIAKGVSHAVNDISRMQSYNKKLKNEVYAKLEDEFYKTFGDFPRNEIKNRYILKRLHEIEMKRNGVVEDYSWIMVLLIIFLVLFLVIFLICMAFSNK